MSSKRVWAVRGWYRGRDGRGRGRAIEHPSIEAALEDAEYLWDAGFGSSMRSYVVPA